MSFAFYLLSLHPHIQQELCSEISRTLKQEEERVTFDTLKKMPYLDGVVLETLRLFPPVALDLKEASRDNVLPNGAAIKKGTMMSFEVL